MSKSTIRTLAITLLGAAIFAVYWTASPKVATHASVSRIHDLGPIQLRLPSGDSFQAGKVDPGLSVRIRVPFINEGKETIVRSHFRQCVSCSQSAKLVASTGTVAPNGSGEFEFEVTASERPGTSTVSAIVEYVPDGPVSESRSIPQLTLHMSYESKSHGLCEWEFPQFDLGDVPLTRDCQCELHFTEQLYDAGPPALELRCETNGVELKIISEQEGHGLYDVKAVNYTVLCRVTPKALGLGRQHAVVLAKTPLGDRRMLVKWNALPEYRFLPNPLVLFRAGEQSRPHSLNLRNLLDEPFVIEQITCDLSGLEIEHSSESGIQHKIVLRLSLKQADGQGLIRVSLRESTGMLREVSVPCVVEHLAGAVVPVPAESR